MESIFLIFKSIVWKKRGEEDFRSYNLMWDRRVVRGNTYASTVTKKIEIPSSKPQPNQDVKQPKPILKQVVVYT